MCGIMAAITENAAAKLFEGLKLLEYRGYDSCGIAVKRGKKIEVVKKKGHVLELSNFVNIEGRVGIAHTRWATHGEPSEQNAHPIYAGNYAVVHNGIIENYQEIKKQFSNFQSETDTEVIVKLLNSFADTPLISLKKTTDKLNGSYAIAVISHFSDEVYLCRKFSSLYLGISDNGVFAMSDINSLKAFATKVYELQDGEFAKLSSDGIEIFSNLLIHVERETIWKNNTNEKEVMFTDNIMGQEIKQSSISIQNTIDYFYNLKNRKDIANKIKNAESVIFVACGTAYHACMLGERFLEEKCKIKSRCYIASEFCDDNVIIPKNSVVIAISQSGETADTVLSVKKAKEKSAYVLGIVNTENSYITKIADDCLYTKAGVERAVAATKSFICQLMVLYLLSCEISNDYEITDINRLPMLCDITVGDFEKLEKYALKNATKKEIFFIGRGISYPLSLEGALKVKEVSGIASEGYASGELKHGALALINENTITYAIILEKRNEQKTINNIREIMARGGEVVLITPFETDINIDVIKLPKEIELLSTIPAAIVTQIIAKYTADKMNLNPDKPKNLAKSVTCE